MVKPLLIVFRPDWTLGREGGVYIQKRRVVYRLLRSYMALHHFRQLLSSHWGKKRGEVLGLIRGLMNGKYVVLSYSLNEGNQFQYTA